ncbi:hypothetical protein [Pelobacter seleniigenes]|uniref:hypothetical protein n=1 Tax=Pelobacter seleniigenes TaxID=407188 RepID=UPI0004A6FD96|nr:hypothetical protein [Pelobacter seleniigenes]
MKSQDIFLLLKLVSIEQRQEGWKLPSCERDWWDWEDWNVSPLKEVPTKSELRGNDYTMRSLALETGISKSQVNLALQRCYAVGLLKPDRKTGLPRVNISSLFEFIVYGLRYVFPARPAELTRGIATGLAAPVLQGKLMSAGDIPPVWSDAKGNTKGSLIEPLFKTVPQAVRRDQRLYAFLALTDAIRMGQPRERTMAAEILNKLLKESICQDSIYLEK